MSMVSIIIPVYNGANYLREAIESALGQTYQNCEIIVVNDGSSDHGATEKIALSFGDRIQYLKKDNGGVASALNMGIRTMKGEYFSWLSHDDMYQPNKIEIQIATLKAAERLTAIIYSDYESLTVTRNKKSGAMINGKYALSQLQDSVFPVIKGLVHGCTLLIHKSHFQRVGLFDEKLITTQDNDLWFRMFRNQELIFVQEPLVISRIHEEQGSKTISTHLADWSELNYYYVKELNEQEIVKFYGSRYRFYYEMLLILGKGENMEQYQFVSNLFRNEDIPKDMSEKLANFKKYITGLGSNQTSKICIFCAGRYGLKLYQDLKNRLIQVDCFSDNNSNKWGYLFSGIDCVPPESIDKNNTLIIVAMKSPIEIVEQLTAQGYQYIVTKQEIEKEIEETPPIKWLVEEQLSNIDYSSPEVIHLIEKFNQTLFEICQYYEENKLRNKE